MLNYSLIRIKNQQRLKPVSNYAVFVFAFFGSILCSTQLLGEGPDYYNYNEFFNLARVSGFEVLKLSRFEPGFSMLAFALARLFTINFIVYSFIVAFALLLKGWGIGVCSQNHKVFIIAAIFYFLRFYPLHELTQLRAACALGLLIVSAIFFWNGRKIFGILACIAALSFHMSAAIVIPALFLYSSTRWAVILLGSFIFALATFGASIVSDYAANNISVVAAYQAAGFGDEAPDPLAITLLLDWTMIAVSLFMWNKLSILMKRVVLIELIGMALFYSLLDFPAFPSRIREAYSVFWLFFVIDGFKLNVLKVPLILFVGLSAAIYGYIYFIKEGFFV